MLRRPSSACWLVLLSVVGIFETTQPAAAQLMSKWGHPVFTIGETPYDSTNTGHGNYPGGPGFIPGYGYYPGLGRSHYPWLDGPGTPFDRRQIAPTPPPIVAAAPPREELPAPTPVDAAILVVKLPAEAELWVNGGRTVQGGSYRLVITPQLASDQELSYTLRVRWVLKGIELMRTESVRLPPGKRCTVNFLTTDGWTRSTSSLR